MKNEGLALLLVEKLRFNAKTLNLFQFNQSFFFSDTDLHPRSAESERKVEDMKSSESVILRRILLGSWP